jgi:MYXO-CTERM domain-containing protein
LKRFLPTVAVALALAGSGALAGWQAATVSGTPVDLQIQDAGQVVFATSTGAYDVVYSPDGGLRDAGSIVFVNLVGGWHDYDGGRAGALTSGGIFRWTVGTPYSASLSSGFGRMRHTSSGMGYALSIPSGGVPATLVCEPAGGNGGASWPYVSDPGFFSVTPLTNLSGGPVPMSALRVGSVDYAVIGDDGSLVMVADAGAQLRFPRVGATRDVALFARGATPAIFVVPGDGGLESAPDVTVASPAFAPATVPGAAPALRGVAFSLEQGSDAGRGFGVAVGMSGTTKAMLRAVPDPTDGGRVWVAGGALPALAAGNFDKVACFGATFCVAIVSAATANNLAIYWNQSPPWLAPVALTIADTASATAAVDAGDDDGDPVFLSWVANDAGYPMALTVLDFDGRRASFVPTTGAFCGTTDSVFTYRVIASDGLASHVPETTATVTVQHAPPLAPVIDVPDASVGSGAAPLQLTATPYAGPCAVSVAWVEKTDSGFTMAWDGGAAITFFPPALACGQGGHAQYEARVVENAGPVSSPPATADVWVVTSGTGPPLAPGLSLSGVVPVPAGSAPVEVLASFADGGCSATQLVWKEQGDSGYRFDTDGGWAAFYPPVVYCSPDAGLVRYDAIAKNATGSSGASTVSFSVEPWGLPFAPVYAAVYPAQRAGTSAVYSSLDAGHACSAAPVAVEAYLIDGGAPSGVHLTLGAAVTVESTFDCVDGEVGVRARNVTGDAGSAAWSDLNVTIQTVLDPLGDAGFDLVGGTYLAATGKYQATVTVAANCLDRRALSAELSIVLDGGAAPSVSQVPVPPQLVAADVPGGGCTGGQFFVTARLFADGGDTGLVARDTFSTAALDARLGEILGDSLAAACGQGARGGLLMTDPAGTYCQSQAVTWEQLDGPALEQPSQQGAQAALKTVDLGLDELIGKEVRLRVSADAGPGKTVSVERAVRIRAEPYFVSVRHHSDSPIADEMGIVSIAVALTNETDCGVTGATYTEELDGLRFVSGTARIDGRPVEAVVEAGALRVAGLDLPARATHQLVYSARPPLLGQAAPKGVAELRGEPISSPRQGLGSPDRRPPPGCGCGGAPAESAAGALVLAAAAAMLGRRRRRR